MCVNLPEYLFMFIGFLCFCPGQSVCSLFIYFLWFTSPSPFSSSCFMFIGLPGFDPCSCSHDFASALPRLLVMTSCLILTLISACSLQINPFFTPTTLCIWVLPHTPPSQSVTEAGCDCDFIPSGVCSRLWILIQGLWTGNSLWRPSRGKNCGLLKARWKST